MPPKKSAEWEEIPADFVLKQNIMFSWNSKDKEFICRVCSTFLDKEELVDGRRPDCGSDEDIFINEDDL